MMPRWFLWIMLFNHTIGTPIGGGVNDFRIVTDIQNGGDGSTLIMTLNWNDTQYSCAVYPNAINTPYSCDGSSATPTSPDPQIPYFMRFEWTSSNPILQIAQIQITDDAGSSYTINDFCIGPTMQCTMNTAMDIIPNSRPSCTNRYSSKDSYEAIALGGSSKLSVLYIDIPIYGSRFANQVVEGGVRPPNLINAGFTTGSATTGAGQTVPVSIQWDNGLYTCDQIEPRSTDQPYTCTLSEPLHCPSNNDFWLSIYSNWSTANFLYIKAISFEDETNTKYSFNGNFCQDPASGATGDTCTDSTYIDMAEIIVGGKFMGMQFPKLVPFFVPDCVFNYPNDPFNNVDVDVGAGSSPSPTEFGWDQGQYGGPIQPECPVTSEPTMEPTLFPTRSPSSSPTQPPSQSPSFAPSAVPSLPPTSAPSWTPTQSPSRSPTSAPSFSPIFAPTLTPSLAPTESPSSAPTQPPSVTPTETPSRSPSLSPSVAPSNAPSQSPSSSPSFVPSSSPTIGPTTQPTFEPTVEPTINPTSFSPTQLPSNHPTQTPSETPTRPPSKAPSQNPSSSPTFDPTVEPSQSPSNVPTKSPSVTPTQSPLRSPSLVPSNAPFVTQTPSSSPSLASSPPTLAPSMTPSSHTVAPTNDPTVEPMRIPTDDPSLWPTTHPTVGAVSRPTFFPTGSPIPEPTRHWGPWPTWKPTNEPTMYPTIWPTIQPIIMPTNKPTIDPTIEPTPVPTMNPTYLPTHNPTFIPTIRPSMHPTSNPTNKPTFNPTLRPTFPPLQHTHHPTMEPTVEPTLEPTQHNTLHSPTDAVIHTTNDDILTTKSLGNTNDIDQFSTSYNIELLPVVTAGIFVVTCVLCCMSVWWNYRYGKTDNESKTSQTTNQGNNDEIVTGELEDVITIDFGGDAMQEIKETMRALQIIKQTMGDGMRMDASDDHDVNVLEQAHGGDRRESIQDSVIRDCDIALSVIVDKVPLNPIGDVEESMFVI
eukprot:30338_1